MKFTPGPWTVGKLRLNNGGIPIVGDDRIAVVDKANGEANALLIAASPDLYASLREIVDEWGCPNTPKWHRAKAALDKAAGAQ